MFAQFRGGHLFVTTRAASQRGPTGACMWGLATCIASSRFRHEDLAWQLLRDLRGIPLRVAVGACVEENFLVHTNKINHCGHLVNTRPYRSRLATCVPVTT